MKDTKAKYITIFWNQAQRQEIKVTKTTLCASGHIAWVYEKEKGKAFFFFSMDDRSNYISSVIPIIKKDSGKIAMDYKKIRIQPKRWRLLVLSYFPSRDITAFLLLRPPFHSLWNPIQIPHRGLWTSFSFAMCGWWTL